MIKRVFSVIELFAVILFAIVVAILNSLDVIIQWIKNPPDSIFTGISHFFADYFLYVSQFAEGARGSWIFSRQLFTNEPMQSTWIYWFNVASGHMGSLLGLSPFASYNILLFLLVVLVLLLWYYLSLLIYPADRVSRLTCFLFITTASSFFAIPQFLQTHTVSFLGQFWFSPGLAFTRLGGVPHQIFQTILFLALTIAYSKLMDKKFLMLHSLFIVLLSFLAGVANPIQMFLFIFSAAVVILWSLSKEKARRKEKVFIFIIISIVSFTTAWLTDGEFQRQSVFVAAKTWELNQPVPTGLGNLLLNIGPIIVLVPFGLKRYFKKMPPLRLLFFIYGISAFALFLSPMPGLLGVSSSRFLGPIPYALLSIIATDGIIIFSQVMNRTFKRFMIYELRFMNKTFILHTSYFILLLIYLLLTIPALYRQVTDRVTPDRNPLLLLDTMYNHVPKLTVEGLKALEKMPVDPTHPVVLTDPHYPIEVLVPVYSGKISFSGHPLHTLYPDAKERLRQQFFGGEMSASEAKALLTNHRIGYVIASPSTEMTYPFLKRIFYNSNLVIYQI